MVGKQAQAFLLGEADAWHERNKDKPREPDPVLEVIERLGIKPTSVLELGCGDGWRLCKLSRDYDCDCEGIEPSHKALKIDEFAQWMPRKPEGGRVTLRRGTAAGMPTGREYDLIIFAFCLYLVDREDLFEVVSRSDRALKDGGHIVIHDFAPLRSPFSRVYKHSPELRSYHMDHSELWLGNPVYRCIARQLLYEEGTVVVIQKNMKDAFPCVP